MDRYNMVNLRGIDLHFLALEDNNCVVAVQKALSLYRHLKLHYDSYELVLTPCRVHSQVHGISHGLKSVHRTLFVPV